mgnify:CR=1 FL=1
MVTWVYETLHLSLVRRAYIWRKFSFWFIKVCVQQLKPLQTRSLKVCMLYIQCTSVSSSIYPHLLYKWVLPFNQVSLLKNFIVNGTGELRSRHYIVFRKYSMTGKHFTFFKRLNDSDWNCVQHGGWWTRCR